MLTRSELPDTLVRTILEAYEAGDKQSVYGVMQVNLTPCFGKLATRFLPIPPLQAHYVSKESDQERDYAIMLAHTSTCPVLLYQCIREHEQTFSQQAPVSAVLLLRAEVPGFSYTPSSTLAVDLRKALLDVSLWILEQGRTLSQEERQALPVWHDLEHTRRASFFDEDGLLLREILHNPERPLPLKWSLWAADAKGAEDDLRSALSMDVMLEGLLGENEEDKKKSPQGPKGP